jgi:hypothetical protein
MYPHNEMYNQIFKAWENFRLANSEFSFGLASFFVSLALAKVRHRKLAGPEKENEISDMSSKQE